MVYYFDIKRFELKGLDERRSREWNA